MNIRTKLVVTFASLAGIALLVSGFALKSLSDANGNSEHFLNGVNARAAMADNLRRAVDQRAIAARNLVLVTKPADIEVEKAAVLAAHAQTTSSLAKLNAMIAQASDASPSGRALVAAMSTIEKSYAPVALNIVELALAGKKAEATVRMNEDCRPLLAALVKASNSYAEETEARSKKVTEEAAAAYIMQRNLLIVASVLSVAFALAAGWFMTRSITGPIGRALDATEKVSAGDLSERIDVQGHDEIAQLLKALDRMGQNLAGIVGQVRAGSEGVATASAEIAQGNNDLSSRTEQQASALEETAASMEELSSTVKQNADNARQANQLAMSASTVAIKGGEVVNQVVDTMKGINDSSKKIADIISVIDGIAFQTNILALNAAVEAARAGEQGRGFAVVASEVRSLAGRSADAAKEIKTLITASVERVAHGTTLVDQAGATMTEVVSSIRRVTDIMGEISAASAEQSAGVAQIGEAVSQMDQATQQNAALVEESAAAAESLKTQAQQLVLAVEVFKLAGVGAHRGDVITRADTTDRRGPNRATNVTRPKFGAKASAKVSPSGVAGDAVAKTGTDDWESF